MIEFYCCFNCFLIHGLIWGIVWGCLQALANQVNKEEVIAYECKEKAVSSQKDINQ